MSRVNTWPSHVSRIPISGPRPEKFRGGSHSPADVVSGGSARRRCTPTGSTVIEGGRAFTARANGGHCENEFRYTVISKRRRTSAERVEKWFGPASGTDRPVTGENRASGPVTRPMAVERWPRVFGSLTRGYLPVTTTR